ncbi:MAG TPA: hypothetical protein VG754_11875, partial [Verrucomicrobiae bacterium]|nr:hypothetical protein [Verrucomicrobiae bacterium]
KVVPFRSNSFISSRDFQCAEAPLLAAGCNNLKPQPGLNYVGKNWIRRSRPNGQQHGAPFEGTGLHRLGGL